MTMLLPDFEGKSAVVTGAAQGIGRSTAIALASLGAGVVVADVNDDAGQAVCAEIIAAGGRAVFVHCDVRKEDEVNAMVALAVAEYGGLDIALNNAAILPSLAPVTELDMDEWQRVFDVNVTGVLLCLRAELRQMVAQGRGGAIVNLASAASLTAYPGRPAYVASKHALVGLTKAAAVEYGQAGVRINALCPGLVMTPMADTLLGGNLEAVGQLTAMFPLGRAGQPDEIARTVVWMLSDATSYMTGAAVSADGGFTAT
jgi:NAD(P)-dependent dehydrogenase (short-subunit alcohol dehydrogenase family)